MTTGTGATLAHRRAATKSTVKSSAILSRAFALNRRPISDRQPVAIKERRQQYAAAFAVFGGWEDSCNAEQYLRISDQRSEPENAGKQLIRLPAKSNSRDENNLRNVDSCVVTAFTKPVCGFPSSSTRL
jgi:hypothetical protein